MQTGADLDRSVADVVSGGVLPAVLHCIAVAGPILVAGLICACTHVPMTCGSTVSAVHSHTGTPRGDVDQVIGERCRWQQ